MTVASTFPAELAQLPLVTDFVLQALQGMNLPERIASTWRIAIDEVFSNIAFYAYPDAVGTVDVRVTTSESAGDMTVTFADHGVPFNPLNQQAPDTAAAAEDRQIGGLGIFMVRQMMDEVTYCCEDGQNVLTLKLTDHSEKRGQL